MPMARESGLSSVGQTFRHPAGHLPGWEPVALHVLLQPVDENERVVKHEARYLRALQDVSFEGIDNPSIAGELPEGTLPNHTVQGFPHLQVRRTVCPAPGSLTHRMPRRGRPTA